MRRLASEPSWDSIEGSSTAGGVPSDTVRLAQTRLPQAVACREGPLPAVCVDVGLGFEKGHGASHTQPL
ncbi:hypothetical protein VFPFJ_09267 [Purpureocillium lilacinum]|uniref:Uncharacterized protein n=1 Tax=Purpureocillium lilacinum TaxID=33203 RepID=A0A179GSF3_PURLI|nr:hypothetical protein VFPFJ_09267 [Purpureocillium lilacinum]OAQ75183.1 hypothetical protein VFPBJ_09158 [Purpureocillium lilacinum]OAQ80814.1 hypothetical protein VFPFJ_09267 [Purpureocillium lilacinum]